MISGQDPLAGGSSTCGPGPVRCRGRREGPGPTSSHARTAGSPTCRTAGHLGWSSGSPVERPASGFDSQSVVEYLTTGSAGRSRRQGSQNRRDFSCATCRARKPRLPGGAMARSSVPIHDGLRLRCLLIAAKPGRSVDLTRSRKDRHRGRRGRGSNAAPCSTAEESAACLASSRAGRRRS
jgi:hypothetical protein